MNIKPNTKRLEGFTLTEVLITLAIIGIVAALTIPTIMTNIQNSQNKAAWKKAFSIASQAYEQAIDDNSGNGFGGYVCGPASVTKVNALMNHLNIIKTCEGNAGGNCWATNGTPYPDGSFPAVGGCGYFSQDYQINTDYAFVTADGMRWLVYGYPPDVFLWSCPLILVDVNGEGKPNQLGVDVFLFEIKDKNLSPVTTGCGGSANSQNYLLQ